MGKESIYYVDPSMLKSEMVKFKKSKIISDDLGNMLMLIARKYASRSNFSGYSFKEDFVSDAIHRMVEQLDKIDLDHPKCNCFSYLTRICHFKFIAKITKEGKFNDMKNDMKEEYFSDLEHEEHVTFKKNRDEE